MAKDRLGEILEGLQKQIDELRERLDKTLPAPGGASRQASKTTSK